MAKKKNTEYNWSPFQKQIFDFIEHENGHLVIEAVAGGGKTSTLIKCLDFISDKNKVLFTAFNTDIVNELKKKINDKPNVDIRTLHSLGLLFIKKNFPQVSTIPETFKYDSYIKENIKELSSINTYTLRGRNFYRYIENIKKYVDFGRFYLCQTKKDLNFIEDRYGIETIADEKEVAIKVMEWGKNALETIDYTDMVWLPNVLFLKPYGLLYDFIFLDECLTYDTLILTSKGNVKLGKLVNDYHKGKELPLIKSFNHSTKNFEYKKIINAWDKGEKEILTIVCNGKKKINCTKNHKILTNNGYVRADEIKIGDFLLTDSVDQPFHPLLDCGDSKELFLISIVGDGSLGKLSKNVYRCKFIHGEEQKEYLEWKSKLFGSCKIKEIKNNGFSKKTAYSFSTKGYCIKDEETNKSHIIDNMTLKQLAINYCDNGNYHKGMMKIYSFVHDDDLLKLFKKKIESFGINCVKIRKSKSKYSNKDYKYIEINRKNSYKLLSMISKYMHPSLSYKTHEDFKNEVGTYEWECSINNSYGATVVSDVIDNNEVKKVYDIEIEDNHNFIVSSYIKKNGVIVHNCQDLNKAERELVLKCFKMGTRLISAGDRNQCVYSFSGSDPNSFNTLKSFPNTTSLPLSISYRCGKDIVKFANRLVKEIQAADDADSGKIEKNVSLENINDGDMIICRNNAPLIQIYNEFLKLGKKCHIRGKDIGGNLKSIVKSTRQDKLNADCKEDGVFVRLYDDLFTTRNKLMEQYNIDQETAINSAQVQNKLDMINALDVLAQGINTSEEIIAKIEEIFSKKNKKSGISLSTIHKAKGLEADNVYIACKSLMPSKSAKKDWEIKQEFNLMYVAYTRAKKVLGFIDEKDFEKFDSSNSNSAIVLKRIEEQVNKILNKSTKIILNNDSAKEIVEKAQTIDKKILTTKTINIKTNGEKKVNTFCNLLKNKKKK